MSIRFLESEDTFNSHFKEKQDIKDGDILSSAYLNTLSGVSASDDCEMVIDNTIPFNHYKVIHEDGKEEIKTY